MPTQLTQRPTVDARQRIAEELADLDAIDEATEQVGLADISPYRHGKFEYTEPDHLADEPDDVRRSAALSWLAKHARIITRVARNLDLEVSKFSDFGEFGVQAFGRGPAGSYVLYRASVPEALTCEMVDTGETEVVPAVPEQVRPIFEKRCPESIFAGVQDEIEVAA